MLSALSNLRVIELARVLAGPWAAQTLADLGADVVKVEHPARGDDTRAWGPPYLKPPGEQGNHGESAYYLCTNRNKRSIAIDFATREGSELVCDLVKTADIVIENFRPGALAKYGLDHESLMRDNPRLIYCSITAFGQSGPYHHRPGYDFAIQGIGGLMSLTGVADGEPGGGPMKVGVAVTDLAAGLYGAIGILAAVNARHLTGRGQHLDLSLFDTQVAMLANQASNFLVSGVVPQRMGNSHPNVVPYQAFVTSDGHLIVAVGSDEQFRRLCEEIGRPELGRDDRFATNRGRVENRAVLVPELAAALRSGRTATWLERLEAAGIPAAPINTIDQVFAEPQAAARAIRVELPHPYGSAPSVASPVRLSATPPRYHRAPPLLGEHTEEILRDELKLGTDRIDALRAAQVVR
jgi:crotonobetainyl-CoA:carnitine CoA-transferase CaiB-like acyl-CoA transferase